MAALQNPPPEPQFPDNDLAKLVVARLADEGVPIAAITRATHLTRERVIEFLDGALQAGQIIEIPPSDWPTKGKRSERSGQVRSRFDRELVVLDLMRTFTLTRQQAVLFHTMIKHKQVSKDMLYHAAQSIHAVGNNTEPKIVDVVVCKLRSKLSPRGIHIVTIWGGGYFISTKHRRAVWTEIGREVSIDDNSGDVMENENG